MALRFTFTKLEKTGNLKFLPRSLQRSSRSVRFLTIWILAISSAIGSDNNWNGFPIPPSEEPVVIERFQYEMRGSVRLLFFWIGKSGVGGGWISRIQLAGEHSGSLFEGWEVLFGTKPEAVPGGHNRWGYARELAFWVKSEEEAGQPTLGKTVFEGFMTRSSEDSLSDVRKGEGLVSGGTAFEGTESLVYPDHASVKIRRFVSDVAASFEDPSEIGRRYLGLLRSTPPDEERTLSQQIPGSRPYGFITAVDSFLSAVIAAANKRELQEQLKKEVKNYIYNARLYSLEIKSIKHHDKVEFGDHLAFKEVFEIGFETKAVGGDGGHRFDVWTSAGGELAGIPLKIVDRPRWWLKVELNLKTVNPAKTVIPPEVR